MYLLDYLMGHKLLNFDRRFLQLYARVSYYSCAALQAKNRLIQCRIKVKFKTSILLDQSAVKVLQFMAH